MTITSESHRPEYPLRPLRFGAEFALEPAMRTHMSHAVPVNGLNLISRRVQLQLAQGLHIRACSRIVAIVGMPASQVRIRCGDRVADASSMFDLIQLVAVPGSELILEAEGDGLESILDSLEEFLSQTTELEE